MVGEQIGEEKENRPPGSAMNFEENYLYKYGNIVVSVVDLAANTKYEIPLSRSFNSRNIIHDLTPAIGVIKNKLTLLYNDDYRKYQENVSAYKVPVLTSITTQGLLEQPAHLEKEFGAGPYGFNMLTRYNHVSQNTITTLLYNGYQLKAGVIQF